MKTIERKLLVVFGGFILAVLLVELVTNNFLLEKYYINENREMFVKLGKNISNVYETEPEKFDDYISTIDKEEGISVYVIDLEGNIIKTSKTKSSNFMSHRLREIVNKNKDKTGYTFGILEDTTAYSNFKVTLTKQLSDENYLVLRKSVKGIQDSVDIANRFFLIVGAFIILIGGMVAIYLAKKITKPVIEMSHVAESVARLDFSKQVEYHAPDEIGQLAGSINTMSKQLSQNIDQLKEDIEHRKQLFRNITHELKTPITVIKGYAEGLQYSVVDSMEDVQEYCTVIVEECNQMDALVREILNYSQLERSNTNVEIKQIAIDEFMDGVAARFINIMNNQKIDFEQIGHSDAIIETDLQLLERLLNNYLTNAINHVNEKRKITFQVKEEEREVGLYVYNTGEPITADDQQKIWQVFYKGTDTQSALNTSHGLGLSIVKTIADILHLKIGMNNEEEGVCFFVKISKVLV